MYTGTLAAASNRTKWIFDVTLRFPDTKALVDLTNATIDVAIRAPTQSSPNLTGSTNDGRVVITGLGTFTGTFSRTDMATLIPGEYELGLRVTLASGDDYQVLATQLPVVDGVVNP